MLLDMARHVFRALLLCSLLFVAWTDDRIRFGEEDERRWNTPPELIPEQVAKKPDEKSERTRSLFIPITANINLNTGENAHSLGFQSSPQGLSYSESNSYNRPLSHGDGSSLSESHSVSFSTGTAGIANSAAQVSGHHHPVYGNQGNADSEAFGLGNGAASSYGTIENGHASSTGAFSAGSTYSFASSTAGTAALVGSSAVNIRFPGQSHRQPIWTNIRPNHNNGHRPSNIPKLHIDVRPHDVNDRRQIKLHVDTQDSSWEHRKPNVHIHKWRPSYASHDFYEA